MLTRQWVFWTEEQVWAFIQGIEFVNDSTITVERDKKNHLVVYTKDSKQDGD